MAGRAFFAQSQLPKKRRLLPKARKRAPIARLFSFLKKSASKGKRPPRLRKKIIPQ